MPTTFPHDSNALLDYSFDWSAWLTAEATTIDSYTLTPSALVTVVTHSEASGVVTARLSATGSGSVACRITCADGQIDERTIYLNTQER